MDKLFGTDGIRGIYGEYPLTPEFILRLGQAAGVVLLEKNKKPVVVIGRDTRESSEIIQSIITCGYLSTGVDVIDVGIITTPGVSWLTKQLGIGGGVVISASHNPYDQNGIKLFSENGEKLAEDEENLIEEIAQSNDKIRVAINIGKYHNSYHLQKTYIQKLIQEHNHLELNKYKIFIDCANGAASNIAPNIFTKLGANIFPINVTPNGKNINQQSGSEFVRRHNNKLIHLMEYINADFGIAFDGDSDRVVFIDEKCNLVDGDAIIGLLAPYMKNEDRLMGNTVALTIMRNLGLKNYLLKHGIETIETPVGDKYIYSALSQIKQAQGDRQKIGLGGEQSGHIILLDENHFTGDGIRTALFVIEAYMASGKDKFSDFVTDLNRTPQIVASAYVGTGKRLSKDDLLDLSNKTKEKTQGLAEINLRYSGTEPLFRAMLQSDGSLDEKELAAIAKDICTYVQEMSEVKNKDIDILNCTSGGVLL